MQSGRKFVAQEFAHMLHNMQKSHKIFGSLKDGKLRLPRKKQEDRRLASWPKKLVALAKQVTNNPTSIKDCWFVPSSKKDGYHEIKLSKDGSRNKYRTHRALRVFLQPEMFDEVEQRGKLHAVHLCGRGRAKVKGGDCCINPHHVAFADAKANQDHKGCKYANTKDCPHEPKCIKTDAKGIYIEEHW